MVKSNHARIYLETILTNEWFYYSDMVDEYLKKKYVIIIYVRYC